jgi:hypothetical protein
MVFHCPRLICLFFFWSLLFYSCKEVSFREPQPAGVDQLKEVPRALQGIYYTYNQSTGEKADTLIIESWGYHMKDKDEKDWLGRGVLNDSLVIKFYQNIYFVNFRTKDQWVLRLIRQKPSGDLEFLSIDIQDDSKRKEMVKKLSKKFTLKEIKRNDDTFYQINPTPDQLMQLIKEGYFTGAELRKIKK